MQKLLGELELRMLILGPLTLFRGGEVNLPPPRDNAENSKNMQVEGLPFSDF